MESKKLEISGRGEPVEPAAATNTAATYKQIPESDMEDESLSRPKSIVKNKSSPEVDGAHEKMLPEEEKKIASNVNMGDVKFTNNDKQNGDAKLDIGDIKNEFVGLGKEELMKFANDPFWVKLRWFLFISFWLLWAGMLIGAILIIVQTPKCSPPEPRTWWEEGPLTEVPVDTTKESLQQIQEAGVKGIIVSWLEDTYKPLNSSETFMNFLKTAKETNISVIVTLSPGASPLWFESSEGKDDNFTDYYIWRDSKGQNASGSPVVPNNWLTSQDTSAWRYSNVRKQFYLTLNSKPQLNFRNARVVNEFVTVLQRFIDAGVEGFQLRDGPHLLVNSNFTNEAVRTIGTNPEATVNQYDFYTHKHTTNLPELAPLLKQWRDVVKNKTEKGLFMLAEHVTNLEPYKVNGTLVIDLPKYSKVFNRDRALNAALIRNDLAAISSMLDDYWTLWERQPTNIPTDVMDYITFLLPGSTLVSSDYKVDPDLLKFRSTPLIMYGSTKVYTVANGTIFAFVRILAGNPGCLVAVNPTEERIVADFPKDVSVLTEDTTVQFLSKNYNETGIELKLKVDSHTLPMSPRSAIVLSYVPK